MSDKPKFPRAAGLQVAKGLCDTLRDVTTRLIVAGSLRRRKDLVGDVEILYIPATAPISTDLFAAPGRVDLAAREIERLIATGHLAKRPNKNGSFTWGEKNKLAIMAVSQMPVDFFAATEENWFNLLVCRTGSKENNTRICNAALSKGYSWKPYSPGFYAVDAEGRPIHDPPPFHVTSERDVFDFVGLPYLEPWER
jgi:DNA polymerase/3'-5' exonuclease PolX